MKNKYESHASVIGFCHIAKFENGEWGINLPMYLTFVFLGIVFAFFSHIFIPIATGLMRKRMANKDSKD
jgi:hypothetical protein